MDYVLTTQDLRKRYHGFNALNGLNMNVPKGAIYGFVGRNGAGKTTLIRLICGLQSPTAGEFSLYGTSYRDKEFLKVRKRIGALVEKPSFYPNLSAEDNLKQQYDILGLPSYKGLKEQLDMVGLADTGNKKAGSFSQGMKQRLGIAIALVGSPDFLILDEPINGLDPHGIIEIRELILRLNTERQITILISSHILDELHRLATFYGFIHKGVIVKEISASGLEGVLKKCLRVTVSDTSKLVTALDKQNVSYDIISKTEAEIFKKMEISELSYLLDEEGCRLISANEKDESLESYFLNITGGAGNE